MNTTNNTAMFHPCYDSLYYFRCRARDNAGNVEPWPEFFDTFLLCIGIDYPPETYRELREEFETWAGLIKARLEARLERLKSIAPETPGDTVRRIIREMRANEPPVADAGEDRYASIDRTPIIVEHYRELLTEAEIIERHPVVEFNGSGSHDWDSEIIGFIWDFGDGTYDCGETVSHRYCVQGEYEVTLTVFDDHGARAQDQINCTISVMC